MTTPTTPAQILELLLPLISLLLFLAGFVLALWRLRRERRGAEEAELDRIQKAQDTLEALLRQSLFGLVTAAERGNAPGTGPLKKSIVMAELLRLLPEKLRASFSAETLGEWVETALEQIRPLWPPAAGQSPVAQQPKA